MPDERERYAEQRLVAANDVARAVSTRCVTFLTVTVYVAVTIAATTDAQLVHASLVTLPLLDVQIPISGVYGFDAVTPWLILLSALLTGEIRMGGECRHRRVV